MKGLLLKDFYMTVKSCKMYLVVDLIFIVMSFVLNGKSDYGVIFMMYPVLISGVIGISLLNYDEKYNWTKYCGTLPYTTAQLVISRYIFGLIFQVVTTVIVFAALIIQVSTMGGIVFSEAATVIGGMDAAALVITSVGLPLCFRFGTEKGRVFYYVFVFGMTALLASHSDKLERLIQTNGFIVTAIAAVVVLYVMSMMISIALYKTREITG